MKRLPLAAALCVAIASSIAAQPTRIAPGLELTASQAVSGVRFGPATGALPLAIIPSGEGFLAYVKDGTEIRALRIDADGHADVAHPRTVFRGFENAVRIYPSGRRALFVWPQEGVQRVSPTAPDGTLRNPDGLPVDRGPLTGRGACNETRCLFVVDFTSLLRASIVTMNGASVARLIELPSYYWMNAGADEDGFLLLGTKSDKTTDLRAVRISNDGRLLFDLVVDERAGNVTNVAVSGSTLLWRRRAVGTLQYTTVAGTISRDGTVVDRHLLTEDTNLMPFALARRGSEWLLGFGESQDESDPALQEIFVQRFGAGFTPAAPPVSISKPPMRRRFAFDALAVNGGRAVVAWSEYVDSNKQVARVALLDEHDEILAREPLAVGGIPQVPLAVAAANGRALAVWREGDAAGDRSRLLCARAVLGGPTLDPEPVLLAEAEGVGKTIASSLGADVLVVWQEMLSARPLRQRLRAAIVHTADGSRDELALPASFDASLPFAAASNGASWLLASGARYVRISRAGVVLTPAPAAFDTRAPAALSIASDGERFVLLRGATPDAKCADCGGLAFAIVKADGTVAAPLQPIASALFEAEASIAFNGRDFLIESIDHSDVHFRRLSQAGAILSFATATPPRDLIGQPLLVPLGEGWLATWLAANGTMSAVRVNGDGAVVDAPLPLPGVATVAPAPDGTAIAARTVEVEAPGYGPTPVTALQGISSETRPKRRAAGR